MDKSNKNSMYPRDQSYLLNYNDLVVPFKVFKGHATALIGLENSGRNSSIRLLHECIDKDTTLFINKAGYRSICVEHDEIRLEKFKEFYERDMPIFKNVTTIDYEDDESINDKETKLSIKEIDFTQYETIVLQEAWMLRYKQETLIMLNELIDEGKHTIICLFKEEDDAISAGFDAAKAIELKSQTGDDDLLSLYVLYTTE